jgi:hypothetical protein
MLCKKKIKQEIARPKIGVDTERLRCGNRLNTSAGKIYEAAINAVEDVAKTVISNERKNL